MQQTAHPAASVVAARAGSEPITPRKQTSHATRASRSHTGAARAILDAALALERLSTTFYYSGLTSSAIMRTRQLGGRSSNPNNPGLSPGGSPHHVRYLQAALDAEAKHAEILAGEGATLHNTWFFFPASTFKRLGTARDSDSFLGVLDWLETASIGLYLAAVEQLSRLGQFDLAQLVAEIAGVEAEHRMLGRVIAHIKPANNLTLEKEPFASVSEAQAALRPFLSGKGFSGAATAPIALPSHTHIDRVVGKYRTRRVPGFL